MERNPRQCGSCRGLALDGCQYEEERGNSFRRLAVRPDSSTKRPPKFLSDAEAELARIKANAILKGCPNVNDGIQRLAPIVPIRKVMI